MLTEQTYLLNIFILFFAIIFAGVKMKSYSKAHEIKKSSANILAIKDCKTGDLPSKIVGYLERYATVVTKDIKDYQIEELEAEVKNYSKTILICKIGDRMELYQEKIIKDLGKQLQNNLQVLYLLNQGAGKFSVPDCRAIQTNISLSERIDEKLLKETLKDLIEITHVEKWLKMKMIIFFLGLLLLGSIYAYFQSKSSFGQQTEESEKLQAQILQMSQSHEDLLQANKRLIGENLKMKAVLIESKQENLVLNENNENFSRENNQLLEKVKELGSQNENLNAHQTELERKYQEMKILYEQELERNKALEKENLELKRLIAELDDELLQFQKKFDNQEHERKQEFSKIRSEYEEELRDLTKRNAELERRMNEDFFCSLSSRIKDLFN